MGFSSHLICLTPSCLQNGTGWDWNPRRLGKWEPILTWLLRKWFCIEIESNAKLVCFFTHCGAGSMNPLYTQWKLFLIEHSWHSQILLSTSFPKSRKKIPLCCAVNHKINTLLKIIIWHNLSVSYRFTSTPWQASAHNPFHDNLTVTNVFHVSILLQLQNIISHSSETLLLYDN